MSNILDKLLQKPENYRRRVALIVTAVLGIFIFAAWLMITSNSLNNSFTPLEETDTNFQQKLPSLKNNPGQTQLIDKETPTKSFETLLEKEKREQEKPKIIEK